MSSKAIIGIFLLFLSLVLIASCTSQGQIVTVKSKAAPAQAEELSSNQLAEEERVPPNDSLGNESQQQATVFPTGNADETELIRQKRYSTLLDFTNLRFENCPRIESELLLQLEQVRDNLNNLERRIDDAYDKILEERAKDEQLSQQGATPTQLSRQKEYVKEAEKLHTKRILERDEAKRLEEQLLSTLDKLHDECVKAEIRERKERIDAERS